MIPTSDPPTISTAGEITQIMHRNPDKKAKPLRTFKRLGVCLIAVFALGAMVGTASAAAAPALELVSNHYPTKVAPGDIVRYELTVGNHGDEPTDGSPVTVAATLPDGVTAIEATDPFGGEAWNCSIAPGGQSVTCELAIPPIEPELFACQSFGGVQCPILIFAEVDPSAAGNEPLSADACGGGSIACASASEPTPISDAPTSYGFAKFGADAFGQDRSPSGQAGAHPWAISTRVAFNSTLPPDPDPDPNAPDDPSRRPVKASEEPRSVPVDLPVGLVGDPTAVERCARADFADATCPATTQVGTLYVRTTTVHAVIPVFNLDPPPDIPAQLGAQIPQIDADVFIDAKVRTGDDYGLTMTAKIPQIDDPVDTILTVWGVPADTSHDRQRGDCLVNGGSCPSSAPREPFLTNATSCSGTPQPVGAQTDSWQHAGEFVRATDDLPQLQGCDQLEFDPTISVQPTSARADSPTGLVVELQTPQNDDPDGLATAHLKGAEVELPAGMSVNPAAADGLGACSPAQIGLDDADSPSCPTNSKIGTVEVETPVLPEPLTGSVYLARQNENPFGSLLAIYLVAEGEGVVIKLPGKIAPDPQTGQLTATFDDNPQLPFETFTITFRGGPRAPLANPPTCGTKTVESSLTPWSAADPDNPTPEETVTDTDTVEITSGPNGTPCPADLAARPFDPGFSAGIQNPVAGTTSPFTMRLTRPDGHQELAAMNVTAPEGISAYLRGVPFCSDSDAAAGTCPEASRVGTSTTGAGAGSNPFYITSGEVFLAGPYKGAPLSFVIEVPAKAGPFDLGTVLVRAQVRVDPTTAQITVVSDELPRILEGIPLRIRDVRVAIDRPGFAVAPTDCTPTEVTATAFASHGAVSQESSRFQVGECAGLSFDPKLGFELLGGKRAWRPNRHPGLEASLTYDDEGANLSEVEVRLPQQMLLDQDSPALAAPCTRPQYAAGECPQSSAIGHATAHSPLLDEPLRGPVYLRTSDNPLPDIVADLDGIVSIDLAGKVDQVGNAAKGKSRIRNTFETVPDVPVSQFNLKIAGGRDGILVNANSDRGLCTSKRRRTMTIGMSGQNGASLEDQSRLRVECPKAGPKREGKGKRGGR